MKITLKQDEEAKVAVIGIKLNVVCRTCMKTWGVYLRNMELPEGWDTCSLCEAKKKETNNE